MIGDVVEMRVFDCWSHAIGFLKLSLANRVSARLESDNLPRLWTLQATLRKGVRL